MTSASRAMDSPLLSAIGRLSSRDRRNVALLSAGALGPAAGVVVMRSLLLGGRYRLPTQPRVMSSAATLAQAVQQAGYGGVLPRQAAATRADAPIAGHRCASTCCGVMRHVS